MATAAAAAGVTIRRGVRVTGVRTDGRSPVPRVTGVTTTGGPVAGRPRRRLRRPPIRPAGLARRGRRPTARGGARRQRLRLLRTALPVARGRPSGGAVAADPAVRLGHGPDPARRPRHLERRADHQREGQGAARRCASRRRGRPRSPATRSPRIGPTPSRSPASTSWPASRTDCAGTSSTASRSPPAWSRSATRGPARTRRSAAAPPSRSSTPGVLRDVLRETGVDDHDKLVRRFDEATARTVEPLYRATTGFDPHRLAEIDGDVAGVPYRPDDLRWIGSKALFAAALRDPDIAARVRLGRLVPRDTRRGVRDAGRARPRAGARHVRTAVPPARTVPRRAARRRHRRCPLNIEIGDVTLHVRDTGEGTARRAAARLARQR